MANRPHALRAAAAEALCEQTCSLLRVGPGQAAQVLRDDCSVSVTYDGGSQVDENDKALHLLQIFVLHVDGLTREEFLNNRKAIELNLAGAQPMKPWLELDDLTFVSMAAIGQPWGRDSLTDMEGSC